ncbi:MAG: molybdopterin-dependent oxidoreductase [bacterium]
MAQQRFQQLAHWGAYTAVVEDGRFVRAEPFFRDAHPSPMLEAMPELVYSEHRVQRPAVREGWLSRRNRSRSGHERYVETDWDTALGLVAGELARVRGEHGHQAVFGGSYGWSSAGRFHHARSQVRRFLYSGGGSVDQLGNYSWGCAQFFLPHVIGTFAPVTGRVTDWNSIIGHTKVMVAFGGLALKNAQVASGGSGEHTLETWLRKGKAAGIEFVVVSPTRSDAPEFLGARWIPIRPNTDAALMMGMAHELVARGTHDRDFLARCCTGYDRFEAYLTGRSDGLAKSPEWAESICGVPAREIRALAHRLEGVRSMLTLAWSLQRAHRGEQPYWMAITLASMLGQVGLPGGGFAFGHGSIQGVGIPRDARAASPELPLGRNPMGRHSIPVARHTDLLENPGGEYDFNGERKTYPDIRMVYWAGGNPFHHHQDLNRMRRAWQRPETIVVHETHWTATAKHADIVLPATTSLERNDIGGASRDRYIIAMQRAIDPRHQARDDFDIFRELAARNGHEQAYTDGLDADGWIRLMYDRTREANAKIGAEQPAFDDWWRTGWYEVPAPARDFVLFEAFREDPLAHPLSTPSGRIEITSERIAGFGYDDCPPHPTWLAPVEWLGAPGHARHPLHLVTNQPVDKLHSQADFGPVARAKRIDGREPVHMNPSDAQARGLRHGDAVRVFNDRGACLASVVPDDGVVRGAAIMATGGWYDPEDSGAFPLELRGNPNVLAPDLGTSKLAQGSSALSILVEVEAWVAPAARRA